MESLMHFCRIWGTEECHPDISELRYPKKIKEGESIPLWPVRKN